MFGTPAGNHAFDIPYMLLELAGILMWIAVQFRVRSLPAWGPGALKIAAFLLLLGLPSFWSIAFPVRSGIEEAARFLVNVPAVGLNLVLAAVTFYRLRALSR